MLTVIAVPHKLRTAEWDRTRACERRHLPIHARRGIRWRRSWGHRIMREFEYQCDSFTVDEAEHALRIDDEVCTADEQMLSSVKRARSNTKCKQ
jgi:hypothetical protein